MWICIYSHVPCRQDSCHHVITVTVRMFWLLANVQLDLKNTLSHTYTHTHTHMRTHTCSLLAVFVSLFIFLLRSFSLLFALFSVRGSESIYCGYHCHTYCHSPPLPVISALDTVCLCRGKAGRMGLRQVLGAMRPK